MRLRARAIFLVSFVLTAAAILPGPTGSASAIRFKTEATGFNGGEPTLGVLKDGTIAIQAFTDVVELQPDAQGDKWKSVYSPPTNGKTLDPYIHVDQVTNRMFSSQLFGACQLLATSDDSGKTWTPAAQCMPVDHQKIGSGPWHDPSNRLYPRAVYSCFNQVADSACSVSPDGGQTWGPQVPVFAGVDPGADKGLT
ncbi:MAG: glycoside hydrolase, partial [Actinomycetota bacterium]|nr:glycoside hydrolase [Actinomycetota bacterium]